MPYATLTSGRYTRGGGGAQYLIFLKGKDDVTSGNYLLHLIFSKTVSKNFDKTLVGNSDLNPSSALFKPTIFGQIYRISTWENLK